jgi:YidC/Oxa1 family membrane protein insertase
VRFFQELNNFFRFFFGTPASDKQLVVYAEHEGYYASFEGIIRELTESHRVPLCYVTSDADDPLLSDSPSGVRVFFLSSLLPYFMLLVKCRVFVMTLTDLNQFHLKRSINPVHYVYVFHSMVSTHMMYRGGAFDHYDSILCVGPHHRAEIRAYEKQQNLPAKELVEAGYYRLERIYEQATRRKHETAEQESRTILIAPSWGRDNLLKSVGGALVELLLKHGYRVIVRPHPETIRRDPELVDQLESAFGSEARFDLERSVATDDSLLTADLLICDLSGVALEYAFGTERPVLFFDVPPKVHYDDYASLGLEPVELSLREQLGEVVTVDDLSAVPATIERLISDREKFRSHLARLRDDYVYCFSDASRIAAAHIMQKVKDAEGSGE